jgi:hypothetical protein
MLKKGGSAEQAKGMQWFLKEVIRSQGWRTADLRRDALRFRRQIRAEFGVNFPCKLPISFSPEGKIFAVLMLEKITDEFDDQEFRNFESWLNRISSWADHDALVHYLIAPMIVARPARVENVFRWVPRRQRPQHALAS